MKNSGESSSAATNASGAVQCDRNSTSDCSDVDDQALYDYYASLMLLMTGLPPTFKSILIVLYIGECSAVMLVLGLGLSS